MADNALEVQSINPADGKPVAGDVRSNTDANSAFFQAVEITGGVPNAIADVRSFANGGGLAVFLIDSSGLPVHLRAERVLLATIADTVDVGGSYTIQVSGLQYYNVIRCVFENRQSSLTLEYVHQVTSGPGVVDLYTQSQPVPASAANRVPGGIWEYDCTADQGRFSFKEPTSATYVVGAIYGTPIT